MIGDSGLHSCVERIDAMRLWKVRVAPLGGLVWGVGLNKRCIAKAKALAHILEAVASPDRVITVDGSSECFAELAREPGVPHRFLSSVQQEDRRFLSRIIRSTCSPRYSTVVVGPSSDQEGDSDRVEPDLWKWLTGALARCWYCDVLCFRSGDLLATDGGSDAARELWRDRKRVLLERAARDGAAAYEASDHSELVVLAQEDRVQDVLDRVTGTVPNAGSRD